MKKLMIAALLLTGLAFSQNTNAQVNVSINIGSQPVWGPSGYNHADFYYIPSINVYYDIFRRQYIYPNGNRWVYASQLPGRYRNFDIYRSYKVVINNRRDPYRNNRNDIAHYGRYRNVYNQPINRDSRSYRNYGNDNGHGHNNYADNNWGKGNKNHNNKGYNGHDHRGRR